MDIRWERRLRTVGRMRSVRRRLLAGSPSSPSSCSPPPAATTTATTATDDADDRRAPTGGDRASPAASRSTLGYSRLAGLVPAGRRRARPGIFEEHGLDVDLRFFADYLGSLDAMAAGQLDGNTQTLNDTMFSVAAGSDQVIVVVNDNSTGNDAIICDESVGTTIEDLAGKTIAAEAGRRRPLPAAPGPRLGRA